MARILIIGGYGAFGARAAERLAREPDLEVVVAGRTRSRAKAEAEALRRSAKAQVTHAALDAATLTAADLAEIAPSVVINASGPFQESDYRVAAAAIAAGCHYVDLADARAFVTGITALDSAARDADVLVVAGASSVPGLSSAVVEAYSDRFASLRTLEIAISPGNSFDPGEATVASVLGGVGQPIMTLRDGRRRIVHGWQDTIWHEFPRLGRRWLGAVDVPDLELFPARYPDLESMSFRAGVEVSTFHLSLWALSWLVRAGIVRRPERLAGPLLAAKRRLSFLGSDRGGMYVAMTGIGRDGAPRRLAWTLVAGSGHGPYIPALPAVILARRLARGAERRRGAMPCLGLVTLDEFMAEAADLDIRATLAEASPVVQAR